MLVDSCYKCHSATAKKLKGKLKLDSWEGMAKGGESGKASVVPGDPDKSLLIVAIRYTDKDTADHDALLMPPEKDDKPQKLADAVIKDFEDWVKMGAPYPKDAPAPQSQSAGPPSPHEHWAFVKPVAPPLPDVKNAAWVSNEIDRFVLAKLEETGLSPNPRADKRTLIRRATFDLIGLPPTPVEVAAFESDPSADAFAKVVDRLLASPRYGERWGAIGLMWPGIRTQKDTFSKKNGDIPTPIPIAIGSSMRSTAICRMTSF